MSKNDESSVRSLLTLFNLLILVLLDDDLV